MAVRRDAVASPSTDLEMIELWIDHYLGGAWRLLRGSVSGPPGVRYFTLSAPPSSGRGPRGVWFTVAFDDERVLRHLAGAYRSADWEVRAVGGSNKLMYINVT